MSAERDFAQRVVRGMLKASCDQLAPAWKLCPVWGTWTPTDERAADEDRRFKAMTTGELLARLEAEGLSVSVSPAVRERESNHGAS